MRRFAGFPQHLESLAILLLQHGSSIALDTQVEWLDYTVSKEAQSEDFWTWRGNVSRIANVLAALWDARRSEIRTSSALHTFIRLVDRLVILGSITASTVQRSLAERLP